LNFALSAGRYELEIEIAKTPISSTVRSATYLCTANIFDVIFTVFN
jgi:hypothetical protein